MTDRTNAQIEPAESGQTNVSSDSAKLHEVISTSEHTRQLRSARHPEFAAHHRGNPRLPLRAQDGSSWGTKLMGPAKEKWSVFSLLVISNSA